MFFKTGKGAQVGDIYMGLIASCLAGDINAFEYLQALHLHTKRVKANAALWLPSKYHAQLSTAPELEALAT